MANSANPDARLFRRQDTDNNHEANERRHPVRRDASDIPLSVASLRVNTGLNLLETNKTIGSVAKVLLDNYNAGEILQIDKLTGGLVNNSFLIRAVKHGLVREYFFRGYADGKKKRFIRLEHKVLQHLFESGFHLSAEIIPTVFGGSYVTLPRESKKSGPRYYMLSSKLPGDDLYSWDNPSLSPKQIASAADVFAQFHLHVADLVPENFEPKKARMLRKISARMSEARDHVHSKDLGKSKFALLLANKWGAIDKSWVALQRDLKPSAYKALLHLPGHLDYHPGNLKFIGEEVSGVFDLDFTRIDARAFDLGLALAYFCFSWSADQDGQLAPKKLGTFISSYTKRLKDGNNPLTDREIAVLPQMMALGNFFIMHWLVRDFADKHEKDTLKQITSSKESETRKCDNDYTRCLFHTHRVMRNIETHQDQISKIIIANCA